MARALVAHPRLLGADEPNSCQGRHHANLVVDGSAHRADIWVRSIGDETRPTHQRISRSDHPAAGEATLAIRDQPAMGGVRRTIEVVGIEPLSAPSSSGRRMNGGWRRTS